MLLIYLEKREPSGKMFVKSWEFVTKEVMQTIKPITGVKIFLETKNVPPDFYKDHQHFFVEDGIVRYSSTAQ